MEEFREEWDLSLLITFGPIAVIICKVPGLMF